jgi:membrane protease YdiL (CAAX protease family)
VKATKSDWEGKAMETSRAPLPPIWHVSEELWSLIAPVGFVVEEVFFRGALDTYLHRGEAGTGWLSARGVSALWGVWHLPGQAISSENLLSTVVGTMLPQILVGVPLSFWWRKSSNLVVTTTTHALLEAARNGLVGAGLF